MDQKGFTLIELIAVIVMIGVMFLVARKHYVQIEITAAYTGINSGITELNSRENLVWIQHALDRTYPSDNTIYNQVDKHLGDKYTWSGLSDTGGTLSFSNVSQALTRTASNQLQPGRWQ